MTLKYLDLTGLNTLVSNIKTWVVSKIPTKTSELTNDSNFITSSDLPTNHVTTDATQTVTSQKIWTQYQIFQNGIYNVSTSYTVGTIPTSNITTNYYFAGNANLQFGYCRGVVYKTTGQTSAELTARNKFTNEALDSNGSYINATFTVNLDADGTRWVQFASCSIKNGLTPYATDTYNIGNATNQWLRLYAKFYYYNGTLWGLDQANMWTGGNIFKSASSNLGLQSTTAEVGSTTASSNWIRWLDKNGFQDAYISRDFWNDGGDTLRISISGKRDNSAPSTSGSSVECGIRLDITANGSKSVSPFVSGDTDLGTLTSKWKTLNGINPGGLSLPTTDTSKLVYFSGDITDLTGGLNSKSFAADGWITLMIPNVSGDYIAIDTSIGQVISLSGTGVGDANIACICPTRAGITNRIFCKCSGGSLTAAYVPCEGNV